MERKSLLQIGDIFEFDGKPHIIWMVNDCRVAANALSARSVYERGKDDFGNPRFSCNGNGQINISPNSQFPIIRRVGERGLRMWIDGGDPMTIKDKPPKLDAKTLLQKYPLRSIIMAMGAQGWSVDKAGKTLLANGVDANFMKLNKWLLLGAENKDDVEEIDLSSLTENKPRQIRIQN